MGQNMDKNICCNQAENSSKPLEEGQAAKKDIYQNDNSQQETTDNNNVSHGKIRPEQLNSENNKLILHSNYNSSNGANSSTSYMMLNTNKESHNQQYQNKKDKNQKVFQDQKTYQNKELAKPNQNADNQYYNSSSQAQTTSGKYISIQDQYSTAAQQDQSFQQNTYTQMEQQKMMIQRDMMRNANSTNNGKQRSPKNDLQQFQQYAYQQQQHQFDNTQQSDIQLKNLTTLNDDQSLMETADRYQMKINDLQEIVNYAPLLKLTVLSSTTLQKGQNLTINCQGLISSLRQQKDGITYFGCKKRLNRSKQTSYYLKKYNNNPQNGNLSPEELEKLVQEDSDNDNESNNNRSMIAGPIINDFIVPSSDPIIADRHRGTHFQIEYNIAQNNYKIKDLGIGFGAFYKLDFPLILKNNHLINIGLIFMVISFAKPQNQMDKLNSTYEIEQQLQLGKQYLDDPEDHFVSPTEEEAEEEDNDGQNSSHCKSMQLNNTRSAENNGINDIEIKFYGGPCQGERVVYKARKNRVITIGRNKEESRPYFNDSLLSKVQCQITFNDKIGWVLNDGWNQSKDSSYNSYLSKGSTDKKLPTQKTVSTNGTWLYLGEEYTIYSGMVFKANQTLFQASIV